MNYRQPFSGSYPITQRYGETITNPNGHTGIDYALPEGTPVLASESGTVILAGWYTGGWGYSVIIRHPDGNSTVYAHLSTVGVACGQIVQQGDVIGMSGSTGNSTGPHLHFEARRQGTVFTSHFDPMLLPLHSVDDTIGQPVTDCNRLKDADQLTEAVEIVAPAGAWGWSPKFDKRQTVFPCGTKLHFTGKTTERLGYTYCECYPEPVKYWVAVHDGETQILDNADVSQGLVDLRRAYGRAEGSQPKAVQQDD